MRYPDNHQSWHVLRCSVYPYFTLNMADLPIKIPPENSLRAIFFPPRHLAFPTTHTNVWPICALPLLPVRVGRPFLPVDRSRSHSRFSLRLVLVLVLVIVLIVLCLLLDFVVFSASPFFSLASFSTPSYQPLASLCHSLSPYLLFPSLHSQTRLPFYYPVADSFFNSFLLPLPSPPFSVFDRNVHAYGSDPASTCASRETLRFTAA